MIIDRMVFAWKKRQDSASPGALPHMPSDGSPLDDSYLDSIVGGAATSVLNPHSPTLECIPETVTCSGGGGHLSVHCQTTTLKNCCA